MSFLSAVLESAAVGSSIKTDGGMERTAITESAALALADEAADVLTSRYVRYQPQNGRSLASLRFSRRLDGLRNELERLGGASPSLAAIAELVLAHEQLIEADYRLERRRLKEATELYDRVSTALDQRLESKLYPELIRAMADIASFKRAKCLSKITLQWRERMHWIASEVEGLPTIIVSVNMSDQENLQEVLNALFTSERINVELSRFSEFFIEKIANMLIKTCRVDVKHHSDSVSIKIVRINDSIGDIKAVVDNFILFFRTIRNAIDFKWEDERTTFSIFGQLAGRQFFDIFIDRYVEKELPTETDALSEAVGHVVRLDEFLREIGFEQTESPLIKFTDTALNTIYDRKCQKLLTIARDLMKIDLQADVVTVCKTPDQDLYTDTTEQIKNRDILNNPYLLTECRISKSVQDIAKMINLCEDQPTKFATKIVLTIKNIVEMYRSLTPQIHKDALESNPLDLALFHNNCFYLAHILLGHPWDRIFLKDMATSVSIQLTEEIHNLRKMAIFKFYTYVKREQQLIEDTIDKSELSSIERQTVIGSGSEFAVIQCLNRLKKLQQIWQPVLTADTYQTAMNNLMSTVCNELIKSVMVIKEAILTEDLAEDLSSVFKLALTELPALFNESDDCKKSRHFSRLSTLTSLLTSPIITIANQWKSKDSQLIKCFSCEEMKHLVRIMFPGNRQKSSVLNVIQ